MASVLAPPLQVVASGAPPFVQVPSGAPPFVVTTGPAPPITIVASGAPPITLFNDDGSIWSAHTAAGGELLLTGETDGFATDFLHPVDAERVALKSSGSTLAYAVDSFYTQSGTSPKMVYDAAGTLGWSPHNYLVQSQTFDNVAWNKQSVTVTANDALAPDGTLTADKIVFATGGILEQIYAPVSCSPPVTRSIYIKGTVGQTITVADGVETSFLHTLTGGWDRVKVTTLSAIDGYVIVKVGTGAGENALTIWLWGAQVNKGSVPTAYLPTTTAARVGLALDFDPVTHAARGLLCEPQATNNQNPSSAFDDALWNKNEATVSANVTAAPDGTTTADALIPNSGSVTPYVNRAASISNGVANTFSVFAKNGTLGNNWLRIATLATPTCEAWFNLATGIKGSTTGAGASSTITALLNGWYRLTLTFTAGAVTSATYLHAVSADNASSPITGNGTSPAVYPWGAQMEPGTVATSYIPTLAATVTRAADQVNVTPASINYSATAGSWWADISLMKAPISDRIIGYVGGSAPLGVEGATSISLFDTAGAYLSKGGLTVVGANKTAAAFQAADSALTANGLAVVTGTAAIGGLLAPGAAIGFGNDPSGAGLNVMTGYIRKLRYLPRRPTNAELVTMTT